ncbi:MAG TPA: hypothetical protein V6C65_32435 [Allocoleopsis sp.]
MDIYISEAVQEAIAAAAPQAQVFLQQQEGSHYRLEDIQAALLKWLELSIEQLADEVLYHCLEGDRALAFNRVAFTQALQKFPVAHTPADADVLEQVG